MQAEKNDLGDAVQAVVYAGNVDGPRERGSGEPVFAAMRYVTVGPGIAILVLEAATALGSTSPLSKSP